MKDDCGGDCGSCARCRDREQREEQRQIDRWRDDAAREEAERVALDEEEKAETRGEG